MRSFIASTAALAMLAAACGSDDGSQASSLDDGADAVDVGDQDNGAADEDPDDTTTDGAGAEDASTREDDDPAPEDDDPAADEDGSAGTDEEDTADDGSSSDDAGAFDPWSDHPLDAEAGRWAVGDAGYVEFALTDSRLDLLEVTEHDGWTARVDDDSSDEIEVEFRRADTKREIEIEIDDGALEIDIDTDIEPAQDGVHDLGPAGSFEYTSDDGLQLHGVVVADGWELRMDDESSDEIEFDVQSGSERWHVEIELDDGEVELEIDYRVR